MPPCLTGYASPAPAVASATVTNLRPQIERLENGSHTHGPLPFGIAAIANYLTSGGLARSALHEIVEAEPATELEDHVPSDHFLRCVDCSVDYPELRQTLVDFYSSTGRLSVDPELMIRMLLIVSARCAP
jgi:hypothetical protein